MGFERFSDLRVQLLPGIAQQAAVRCVLYQRVFEAVNRVRWHAALEDQLGGDEAGERGLAHLESQCSNFYDSAEVERVFYPEIEKLLLEFFPDATDALVYNHDVFDK